MAEPYTTSIHLFITSDLHGYIYPINYRSKDKTPLGLSRLATIVKKKRETISNMLLLDNGDAIQGSPFSYYHASFKKEKPNPVIQAMNYLKYDAATIGNHEFSYGLDHFRKAVKQSAFPWISANIVEKKSERPAFFIPYIMKTIDGVRIAILGLTTHFLPYWEDQEHLQGIEVKNAAETAKKWVETIQREESPDVLIVSYHGGIERDLDTGILTEPSSGENQAYQICREVADIDILITGHQHRTEYAEINGVTVIQPGSFGRMLGEIEIKLKKQNSRWSITEKLPTLTEVTETDYPDSGMLQLLQEEEQEVQQWLDEPIGTAEEGLQVTDPFQLRLNEHPFVELVNKVQMEAAGAEISCTAFFDEKAPGFNRDIKIRDVVANYTYPNTLKVKRLTGYDIKQALEKSATYFHLNEKGEVGVSYDYIEPKPRHYVYDMWEGIQYEINLSSPVGSRITKLEHQGKPVIYDQHYDVVMNNYRAGGGGEYSMFAYRPVIRSVGTSMVELLIRYIKKHSPLKAECNHNWKVTWQKKKELK